MNLKNGARNKALTNKTDEIVKIYKRSVEYFSAGTETECFTVESPIQGKSFSLRKRGSDLGFKLTIGEHDCIYLEVILINSTLSRGNSFSKSVVGTIEYKMNGDCENKRKVCLPNNRQQVELQEIVDHVQRSIRPNSINFIMGD